MRKQLLTAGIVLLICLIGSGLMMAQQSGGQFCVRAFEDLNGNGQRDGGEPVLMRDVGAELMDATGVIVNTAVMSESPNATQGVMCFQYLPEGQYTLVVTSAEFNATTLASMVAAVGATDVVTLEFGGQRLVMDDTPVTSSASTDLSETSLERLLLSGLGALAVVAFMTIVGVFIFLLVYYPRLSRALPDPRRTTGGYPAVYAGDTGSFRPMTGDTGSYRPVTPPPGSYPPPSSSATDTDEHPTV